MSEDGDELQARAFLRAKLQSFVDANDDLGTRSAQQFILDAESETGVTDHQKLLFMLLEEREHVGYRGVLFHA